MYGLVMSCGAGDHLMRGFFLFFFCLCVCSYVPSSKSCIFVSSPWLQSLPASGGVCVVVGLPFKFNVLELKEEFVIVIDEVEWGLFGNHICLTNGVIML